MAKFFVFLKKNYSRQNYLTNLKFNFWRGGERGTVFTAVHLSNHLVYYKYMKKKNLHSKLEKFGVENAKGIHIAYVFAVVTQAFHQYIHSILFLLGWNAKENKVV